MVVSALAEVSMEAEPALPVVPVMTRLAPEIVAVRPEVEKPESALRAAAVAVRESGVEPRLTVAEAPPPMA